jgi:DnaJ-class molecular chaperone
MDGFKDFYAVLGIAPTAAPEVVRAAYRALAQRHHPDRMGLAANDGAVMAGLNRAYEVLSCPHRRYEYDQVHRRMQAMNCRDDRDSHASSSQSSSAVVFTTYDHRGRLRAYA